MTIMVRFCAHRNNNSLPNVKYLAKLTSENQPGLSVEEHCRIAGTIARAIIARMPEALRQLIPQGAAALVALHDVGKINPCFLRHIYAESAGGVPAELTAYPATHYRNQANPHAQVSEDTVAHWFSSRPNGKQLREWALVAGAHHGGRRRQGEPVPEAAGQEVYGGKSWLAERESLIDHLARAFGGLPGQPPATRDLWLATGLTCVADWIASDEEWFDWQGIPSDLDLECHIESVLDDAGWIWPEVRPMLGFEELFPQMSPNAMQRTVFDTAQTPGLYIVEAPMGMGKTEAALWAAYRLIVAGHNHGIYFGLPTQLTSNRIHERVNCFLKVAFGADAAARLLHGSAWVKATEHGGKEFRPGGAWFSPAKRGLLLPFGVGTVDQALLGVLKVRHNFLRLFGLAGKVVILDEVHSYDMFTGTLIDRLVEALLGLGCSVFILSATLTQARRSQFIQQAASREGYPLISTSSASGRVCSVPADAPPDRRFLLRRAEQDPTLLANRLGERADAGVAVLWIANTVDRAQTCYKMAKAAVRQDGADVGLLHSRFPAFRREALETEWITRLGKSAARNKGCVLVATQVMEQSVDVDADLLVTDLAPTDMMLQRMGRVWRHERADRRVGQPETWITTPDLGSATDVAEFREMLGGSFYVYSPYVLWRTYRVWRGLEDLLIPSGIRTVLEATYIEPRPDDPEWAKKELWEKHTRQCVKLRNMAIAMGGDHMLTMDDDETTATRYGLGVSIPFVLVRAHQQNGNAVRLLLLSGEQLEFSEFEKNFRVAKALHLNLVHLRKNRHTPEFDPPKWLRQFVRGTGKHAAGILVVGEDGGLRTPSGGQTSLAYTDELGVFVREHEDAVEEARHESDW
ncbi:MAG: CRISPR-associated helicase Cas3' [Candidatus Eisenbacteria sp.]|nr:CRISPR-associated helicase Cas3' [Candidatus Eisenbacteria bacterium]